MCGIAGILYHKGQNVEASWLKLLSDRLDHRGPDDAGYLGWPKSGRALVSESPDKVAGSRLALLHRRLSIIDLSKAGWQPMQSEDGAYSIVFNGEIYNFVELREELEKEGHRFDSHSDSEVLLRAYMHWGQGMLTRLVGMFAFAILDLRRGCLFLARDFFGIKPLYYCATPDAFGFASETTTLLEFTGVSRRARADRLYSYLRFGTTDYGGDTFWVDIHQLPPAHYIEVSLDTPSVPTAQRYWRIPSYEPLEISFQEAADRFRHLLQESVRLHLRSDVPVGTCLSGGLDSSAITMLMRNVLGNGGDVRSFSFIATDERLCEEQWVDIVATEAKTVSQKTQPTAEDLVASLQDLVRTQGEPFGSTSIFAQYKVFELAAQNRMKVMLDGQGADEMLGGYWSFLAARIASLLSQGHLLSGMRLYQCGCQYPGIDRGALLALAAGSLLPGSFQALGRKFIGRDLTPAWLNVRWFEDRNVAFAAPWHTEGPHHLRSQLLQSMETVSLPMLLRYEDRNSMRFSIESRVPFLTPQIAEFLFSLPERYLIDETGLRKSVFRTSMRGLVPDSILDRRDKIGFATSESQWMKSLGPWVQTRLKSDTAYSIPALCLGAAGAEWQGILSGQRPFGSHTWRWINLIEWVDQFQVTFEA